MEVTQGSEKGAKYELYASEIRIGRIETNDIILSDAKCSREHAIIKITPQAAYIEDLGSQNGLLVDGEKSTRAFLTNGSKIQIGSTVLTFRRVLPMQTTLYKENREVSNSRSSSRSAGDSKKIRFYAVLGTVILIGAFLFLNNSSNKGLKTETLTVDQEIEASQKRQEELTKRQLQDGLASRQYLDAQASYMKGLRDYREGYYKTAVTAFSAAISIYPDHKLARRYLRLSQNKLDEQIQVLMSEGNKAMEENKYQLAQSSFKNVMILINDTESKTYQEAREKLNECNLLLRESF